MSGLESVPSAYLSIGFLTVVGILMPLTNFIITWVVRPRVDPARPHITKSYLLEGYERDHSLYPRRLTTFECGSEPVGEAMIQFHFQYYMFAILFVVFDLVVVFLILWVQVYLVLDVAAKVIMMLFLLVTLLGLWYAFRKEDVIWI